MKLFRWIDIKNRKSRAKTDQKKLDAALAEVAKSPIPDEMFLAAYNVLLADPYFRDDYQGSLSDLVEEMLVAGLKTLTAPQFTRLHFELFQTKNDQ